MSDKTDFILRFSFFAAAHSLFATSWAKKALRGTGSKVYRLFYNIASIAMFWWVMSVYRHSEVLYFAPGPWGLVMYLLQLVVAVILLSCLKQTGIGEFFGFTGRSSCHSFAISGWYSVVRHPLYLFSIIFMALTPVMTAQWLCLTIMGTVYFVIGGIIEEKRLVDEFGEPYRKYQERIPFIIPQAKKTGSTEVNTR